MATSCSSCKKEEEIPRIFSCLTIQGNVNAALRYNSNGGVPSLDSVIDVAKAAASRRFYSSKQSYFSSYFDCTDAYALKTEALRTQGGGGSSGVDSTAWRRLCCSFHSQSIELYNASML